MPQKKRQVLLAVVSAKDFFGLLLIRYACISVTTYIRKPTSHPGVRPSILRFSIIAVVGFFDRAFPYKCGNGLLGSRLKCHANPEASPSAAPTIKPIFPPK